MGTTTQTTAGSAAKRAMDVPFGTVRAVEGNLFGGLGDRGAEIIEQLKSDAKFMERVQKCMLLDGYCESSGQITTREIFEYGRFSRYWGLCEWKHFFGVNIHDNLSFVPNFSWRDLWLNSVGCPFHKGKQLRETFFCYLGLMNFGLQDNGYEERLTLQRLQEILDGRSGPKLRISDDAAALADDVYDMVQTHWYVISIDPVSGSHNRNFHNQVLLLPKNYNGGSIHKEERLNFSVPYAMEFVLSRVMLMLKNIPFQRDLIARCYGGDEICFAIKCTDNDVIEVDTMDADKCDEKCVIYATLDPPCGRISSEYQL